MGAGILALFGVVLAAALADHLVPSEDAKGTRQALHFLTALVVLTLLLRPFLAWLGNADDFLQGDVEWAEGEQSEADFEQLFSDAVASRSAAELRSGLYKLLEKEYGIAKEDCEIGVVLTESGELSRISIFLSGAALLQDPEEIEGDLRGRFDCAVEVR